MGFMSLVAPAIKVAGPSLAKALGPSLISGGASLLGGLIGNRASAKEAETNRNFQEHMSATSHQREVADLRAAGLNPILSGTGGMGASTPSGSMAGQHDPISGAVTSAMAARRLQTELDVMEGEVQQKATQSMVNLQQERALVAQEANTRADTTNKITENPLVSNRVKTEVLRQQQIAAERDLTFQRTATERAETRIRGHDIDTASARAAFARNKKWVNDKGSSILDGIDRGIDHIDRTVRDLVGGSSAKSRAQLRPSAPPFPP